MTVLSTERLVLRHLTADDAEFILVLMNDPDWLRYIGDRGIRTADDARGYIATGPVEIHRCDKPTGRIGVVVQCARDRDGNGHRA